MQKDKYTYLNLLTFSILNLWDVKRYTSEVNLEFGNRVRLRDILVPYSKTITKNEIIDNQWRIIAKINFGGELFLREFNDVNTYKGNLTLVPENSIIFSKINVRHGCIYFHDKGKTPFCVSSEYPTFVFDETKVNGAFLQMLLRTSEFKKLLNSKSTGISKARVKKDEFLDIEIPLPEFIEQEGIVNAYNQKIEQIKQLDKVAEDLEREIEEYLFKELLIKKGISENRNSKINIARFNDLIVWGVERNLRGGNKAILHSEKFENKKLSNILLINPRTDLTLLDSETNISFIPMECVSDEYGEVMELREGRRTLSGGYTKFQEGDLIWARITPCMQNGKSAIVKGLKNKLGYGSTEFHVIRQKDNNVNLDYIYHILRTKTVLNDAQNYFTGSAGQQRVPKSYLEELEVPTPPIEVQEAISNTLYELKSKIKNLKTQSVELRNKAQEEFEKEIFN